MTAIKLAHNWQWTTYSYSENIFLFVKWSILRTAKKYIRKWKNSYKNSNISTLTNHLDCYQTICIAYNCGKVMGNNAAVYQVIKLLLYYLYYLMLNIWGKNIRNKKLTIKSFLEEFQFVLKCLSNRFKGKA